MKGVKIILALITLLVVINCDVKHDTRKAIMDSFKDAKMKEQFKVYHFIYEKTYDLNTEEGIRRYKIFKQNVKEINHVNAQNLSYKFGINKFSDLTSEEFAATYLMKPELKRKDNEENLRFLEEQSYFDQNADIENDENSIDESGVGQLTNINWKNYMTPPRDQENCGSCWAFATTGLFEGLIGIKNKVAPNYYLSPQQLIDCDSGNNGCDGGNYGPVMKFIKTYGLVEDKSYPYLAYKQNICRIRSGNVKLKSFSYCSNYSRATSVKCSVDKVKTLLSKGPALVGIDAKAIQSYLSGVYTGSCQEDNHAVVLVGYSAATYTTAEHWTIRNSWGADWGENGYIRVARSDQNLNSCYIANEAYTATLA